VDGGGGERPGYRRDPELIGAAGKEHEPEEAIGHYLMAMGPRVRLLRHAPRIGGHSRTGPLPEIRRSWARNLDASVHAGPLIQSSSRLIVSVKVPVMPR
jgi:hypothetical protein